MHRKIIKLSEYEIDEIFDKININRILLTKYIKSNQIKTKFLFMSECKNYIFYSCYKKINKCKGTAKINKNTKDMIITNLCEKIWNI